MNSSFKSGRGDRPEPIAIIGLAAIFPGAGDLDAYWAEILSGREALTDIPAAYWSAADYYDPDPKAQDRTYAKRGGFLSPTPFDPLRFGIAPNDLPSIDSVQLLALVAADRALADAGYPAGGGADHRRTAVILGVTGALKMVVSLGSRLAHPQLKKALADSGLDEEISAEILKRFANEFTPWTENSFPGLLGNVVAGRIAGRLDLGGANLTVDAACASSLAAVRHALMELRSRQADLVVTGGADAFNDPFMFTCFSKTPALSPAGRARAFDRDGDGAALGEGVGLLTLKRLSDAKRDGDRLYAIIREVGSTSDGKGAAIFAPTAAGQERALAQTYELAGVDPGTVELVEGHGTGTNVGDAVEVEALTKVFRQSPRAAAGRPWCALGSVKAQIGHAKAAAGAAGLIKAALALYHKALPPASQIETPLAELLQPTSPFHLSTRPRPWVNSGKQPRRAAVSAFGFGGTNFHCLLEEAGPARPDPAFAPLELLALSGDGPDDLRAALKRAETQDALAAAASRKNFRPTAPARLILIRSEADRAEKLRLADELLSRPGAAWPPGLFFGQGPAETKSFGLLLPPASEAGTDLFRQLALSWPEMLKSLGSAQAAQAAQTPELGPLGQLIYPPDLAGDEFKQALETAWADPRPRRTAWRAVAEGLTALLARFGLKSAATADLEETGGDLAELLARPELRPINLWLTLALFSAPADSGGVRFRPLADGWAGLAELLAELAAEGWPVDLSAWPDSADPVAQTGPGFKVMISGANIFTKKEIPASPPRAAGRPAAPKSALEILAEETNRLHQDFLRRQSETLRLLSLERAGGPPLPPAPAAAPAQDGPASGNRGGEAGSRLEIIMGIVSQETGYPREALNPDLSLEGDLGLDSIKKVEIISLLSEKIGPPLAEGRAAALSEAVTLRDLAAIFRTPAEAAAEAPVKAPAPPAESTPDLWPQLRAVVARETGYPLEMLTPSMKVSEDLGLDSIKMVEVLSLMSENQDRAEIVSAEAALKAATLGELAEILARTGARPAYAAPPVPAATKKLSAEELVFEITARETGYPREALNLNLTLEGDLGLDSIKKVEIMSALSESGSGAPVSAKISGGLDLQAFNRLGDLLPLAGGRPVSPSAPEPSAPEPSAMEPSAMEPPAMASRRPAGVDALNIIKETLSKETGYPYDSLKPEMNLESDLGLDSIKRVEIMSALLEKAPALGLAVPAPESLNEAGTLAELAARLTPAGLPAAGRPADFAAPPDSAPPKKRGPGRPPKNSSPPFETPAAPIKIPAAPVEAVPAELAQASVFHIETVPADLNAFRPAKPLEDEALIVAEDGPLAEILAGHYGRNGAPARRLDWRAAENWAEAPERLGALILVWPEKGGEPTLPRTAFRLLKTAGPALKRTAEAGRPAQALGLTFMGGAFGFGLEGPAESPGAAALVGLIKTAAREWPWVMARAVDLPEGAASASARLFQPALLAALGAADAPLELGLARPDRPLALRLVPYQLKNIRVRYLKPDQTVLVTGGARGVTAAALKELAKVWSPHLIILGRTPLKPEEPAWLKDLTEESAIRQAIWRMSPEKPEPAAMAQAGARVLAEREVRANLAALEAAGARVTYVSGNFGEATAVRATLAELKSRHGPIHGFIHGAGILADSLIMDKKEDDFDRVFNAKAGLADLILNELKDQPLNLAAFFSSSTARFGRRGQADYAAGNEYLNKLAGRLAKNRPGLKCLSLNWGPWAGGMVNDSLARLFRQEGVGLISLSEGAKLFASLLGTPKHDPVEMVILGRGTKLNALAGRSKSNGRA